jgi:O-antigen/teichoic acid export membrane protein
MGKVMMFEIGVQAIGTVATVLLAWVNPSVWALVIGSLIGAVCRTILSHTSLPQRTHHRFRWDKAAVDDIISFGKWIFFSTAVTFLATQSDRLLLGKFASISFLGIYTIAFTLGDLPRKVNQKVYAKVLFPVMSKISDSPRAELRLKIMKSRQLALLGLMIIVLVLAGFGDIIINFLYTEEYSQAGWILSIIALGLWPNLLADTLSPCLFAIGQHRYVAFGNLFSFLFILVGIPFSFSLIPENMSRLSAVGTVALSEVPFYIAIVVGLVQERLSCIKQDVVLTSILVILLAGVIGLRLSLGLGTPLDAILAP